MKSEVWYAKIPKLEVWRFNTHDDGMAIADMLFNLFPTRVACGYDKSGEVESIVFFQDAMKTLKRGQVLVRDVDIYDVLNPTDVEWNYDPAPAPEITTPEEEPVVPTEVP